MARKKYSRSRRRVQPRSASWKEFEFLQFEKGTWWYTVFIIVMLVILGITLWRRNWLLAGVIVAGTLAIISFAKEKPAERQFRIDSSGVQVGNKKYKYEELKSFWIVGTPDGRILYLQSISRFSPPIMVNLGNNDEVRIRRILKNYLPEEVKSEVLSDRINRWLRF